MIGYDKPLYILPFDHRSSFYSKLFGFSRPLTKEQKKIIEDYKKIVFRGFKKVRKDFKNKDYLAILVDEEFGNKVIKQAKRQKINLAVPVEKSGQDIFEFEYGSDFKKHIKKIQPAFAKALVRYNPNNKKTNQIQIKRLKELNNFCKKENFKLIIELLVPPTKAQEKKYSQSQYDKKIRPKLAYKAISEFYKAKIEPDIWKLEAMEDKKNWEKIIDLTTNKQRIVNTKIIVLGRGENKKKVNQWLKTAAPFYEITGFAVGRTVFLKPLRRLLNKKISKKQAVDLIAKNYRDLINLWQKNRK